MGAALSFSAIVKIARPYEFLTSVLHYEILGPKAATAVAALLPFVELILGVALLGGFWTFGASRYPHRAFLQSSARCARRTRYGDANLDDVVNLIDFNRLVTHFGTGDTWSEADFNYDNTVNLMDFNLLAQNFGFSAAGPEVTPEDWATLAALIPEPSLLLSGMATLVAMSRRARRRAQ